jgi:hypothetical protein
MEIKLITTPLDLILNPCLNPYTEKYDGEWFVTMSKIEVSINGDILTIPHGFVTDLGSVPKRLRGVVNNAGISTLSYIVHDYLGKKNTVPVNRLTADIIMYKLALLCGQTKWEARLAFWGTRIGGHFLRYFKKDNPQYLRIPATMTDNNRAKVREGQVVTSCYGLCEKCLICFQ